MLLSNSKPYLLTITPYKQTLLIFLKTQQVCYNRYKDFNSLISFKSIMKDIKERFFAPLLQNTSPSRWLEELRNGIILSDTIKYFDWTASGLAYQPIEDRIAQILPFYSNTHSETSLHAEIMSLLIKEARERLTEFFGLDSSFVILPSGFGSSGAIKKFQEILGVYLPPKTAQRIGASNIHTKNFPLVLIGPYEHHSNELSFRESPCEVIRIPLNSKGEINLNSLEDTLKANTHRQIIASFTLASNVTGIIVPFMQISNLVRKYGGIMCYDMATSSPYFNIPKELYDVAFLSPHKLLGGIGSCGLLIIKRDLIDKTLPPTFSGGGVVGYVSRSSVQYFATEEIREEAGTPSLLQFLRASLAYQLRYELGELWILEQELQHIKQLDDFFANHDSFTVYGNTCFNRLGIYSFNLKNINPYTLSTYLCGRYGILTRAGCSCAGPYGHDLLGLRDNQPLLQKPGWVRLNVHYTHTKQDIEDLCNSLESCIYR